MAYLAVAKRYQTMQHRTCGRSGLKLPASSLGLWHDLGDTASLSAQRELVCAAIGLHAVEGGVNLRERPSTDRRP